MFPIPMIHLKIQQPFGCMVRSHIPFHIFSHKEKKQPNLDDVFHWKDTIYGEVKIKISESSGPTGPGQFTS